MKKILIPCCLFLGSITLYAQKKKTTAHVQKDEAVTYASLITEAGLKTHLSIIASDSMQGRETGTLGQRMAAEYIEQQFKKLGLAQPASTNGYQQTFPIGKDSIVSSELLLEGKKLTWGADYIAPVMFNKTGSFSAESIVFAGYGIEDPLYSDYENITVKGKLVMMMLGEPKKEGEYFLNAEKEMSAWTREAYTKKTELAKQKGAVGVLFINPKIASFDSYTARYVKNTGFTFPLETVEKAVLPTLIIPHDLAIKIMGDGISKLIETARSNGWLTGLGMEKNTSSSFQIVVDSDPVYASNVLGVLEGSEKKDEYLFLTAHYDHLGIQNGKIYNGADDDGSGTVAVLQMAEAFVKAAKEGKRPKRSIVFMLVSGEEKGLWGSEYYTDHPIYPLEKTTADLNTDMIGRVDTERKKGDTLNYVYVVGHNKLSSELPIINESVNNKTTKLVLDYKFDDPNDPNRIYYRSDHYNFARKGVPVLFFYDGMLQSDYHKPTDDVEKINFPLYAKRARMIFLTAWEMANKKEMLKRDLPMVDGE